MNVTGRKNRGFFRASFAHEYRSYLFLVELQTYYLSKFSYP